MRLIKLALFVLFIGFASYLFSNFLQREFNQKLPNLGKFKTAKLEKLNGDNFTGAEFIGNTSVVNFFFTSCKKICPLTMSKLAKLEKEYKDKTNIKFYSITVDPQRDTKEKLKKHADNLEASSNWTYLRGEKSEVARILTEELNLVAGETPDFHTTRAALIDKNLSVRAYYDLLSTKDIDKLKQDILYLDKETN